jgi:hypothetical protein
MKSTLEFENSSSTKYAVQKIKNFAFRLLLQKPRCFKNPMTVTRLLKALLHSLATGIGIGSACLTFSQVHLQRPLITRHVSVANWSG